MDASRAALLDEAMKKSGLVWVTVPGRRPAPVWYVWRGGADPAAYVLTGGGEQPVPGLLDAVSGAEVSPEVGASPGPAAGSDPDHGAGPDPGAGPGAGTGSGVGSGSGSREDGASVRSGAAEAQRGAGEVSASVRSGAAQAQAGAAGVTVMARSKDTGALLVGWAADVAVVAPDSPEWAEVLPDLQAKRLNPPDGLDAPQRWARDSHLIRLTPTGRITAGPAAQDPLPQT